MMIEKGIKGDQIFFPDEKKIELEPNTNDSVRLSKKNQEKLKNGVQEAFDIINRSQKI